MDTLVLTQILPQIKGMEDIFSPTNFRHVYKEFVTTAYGISKDGIQCEQDHWKKRPLFHTPPSP